MNDEMVWLLSGVTLFLSLASPLIVIGCTTVIFVGTSVIILINFYEKYIIKKKVKKNKEVD